MRLKWLLFLCFLLLLQKLSSQTTVTFEVLDHLSDEALFNAHVQLLHPESKEIIQFGSTDRNGQRVFKNIERDSLLIVVTFLGYQREERFISTSLEKYTFRLIKNNEKLEEVVITSYPRSFTVKEDTLSYNLKSVVDGTERNLGDALRKLPGIEVDADGIVKHQGVKLDHILVDGSDFFGNKHQMATQNLKPEMIDQAEIIQNYSESSMRSKGNKTVLNLTLQDEYKNKIIGDIAVSYGVRDKYVAHGNFFRFVENGNLSVVADFNKIGKTPITLEDYMEMRGGISEFVKRSGTNQITKLDSKQFPSFIFNNENFVEKKNNFIALNYTRNTDKLKISGYSFLNHSKQRENIFKSKTLLNEVNLNFEELFSDQSDGVMNATYLKLNYRPNEKNHWNLQLSYNPNQDDSDEEIEVKEEAVVSYWTKRKNHNFNLGYNFSYEGQLKENLILTSELTQNYMSNKSDLNSHSTSPFLFYGSELSVSQNYRFKSVTSYWNTDLEYKSNRDNYKLSYAYLNEQEDLNTAIFATDYVNSLNIVNQTSSFSFHTNNYLSSKWVLASENKLNLYRSGFQDAQVKIRYEPMLSISYLFSFSHKLFLNGTISNKNFGALHLLPKPMFIDYRTVLKSEIKENDVLNNSRNITMGYVRFEPLKELVLSLNIGYTQHKNKIILTNTFVENIIINNYVFSPFEEDYSVNIRLDKKFRKIPFGLKNMLQLNHSKSKNFLNNKESIQTNKTIVYRLGIFSHFKNSVFQFELNTEYDKRLLEQSYNKSIAEITNFNSSLSLRGLLKEGVVWDMKFTNLSQKSPLGKNNLFYISPSIHMDSKNKKWIYSLYGNNILNLKNNKKLVSRFTNISIDNTQTSMLDGYVLVGVKYNL